MTPKQIYGTINSIAKNMTKGEINVIDASTLVAFGNDVLSSQTNTEKFYNLLVDRIGKTVFAIKSYASEKRNVLIDSFEFGSILQKISYKLQDAEENSDWTKAAQNPYTLQPKGGVVQSLYSFDLPTFSFEDVLLNRQLHSAFTDANKMAGFINGLATRMYNALEIAKEGMNNVAINAFAGKIALSTDANASRKYRNLLAEFKTLYPTSTLTAETCLLDRDFLEYACVQLGTVIPFMGKLTSMYNDGTVERFTAKEDLVIEVNTEFEQKYNVYLKSNTFHDELVALPKYNTVPYWDTPADPMAIEYKNGTETASLSGVIAIFRDKNAVATTLDHERYVSKYDEWNDRTYVKLAAERRCMVDTSENGIVFYVEDAA